jgi:hypothetical protein
MVTELNSTAPPRTGATTIPQAHCGACDCPACLSAKKPEGAAAIAEWNRFADRVSGRPNATVRRTDRPEQQWVRGTCPECGEDLVSNMDASGGDCYLIFWECWASLGATPTCNYRRAL